MALNFAGVTLTPKQEKLIRDNLAQPGQSIIQDAVDSILTQCEAGSMTRAHEQYVDVAENGTAAQKKALPVYTDTDAMLSWYFKTSKTKDQRIVAKAEKDAAKVAAATPAEIVAEAAP